MAGPGVFRVMVHCYAGAGMLRRTSILVCLAAIASVGYSAKAPKPDLVRIKTVYLLPMGNGLDQYIANRLTRQGPYQVVTDPALADAVFTDKLGRDFETRIKELYPPPPPPAAEKDEKKSDDKTSKRGTSLTAEEKAYIQEQPVRVSSWNRAKGNFFLVDRESKRVVWSYYGRPWTTQTDDLHRLADKVVDKLKAEARQK